MKRPPTKSILFHWFAPIAVLLFGGWFVYAMGSRDKPDRKKPLIRKSVQVEVVSARLHTGTLDVIASGVVIPHREVELSARVGGEVVFKSDSLSPGRFVTKGETLLRIDNSYYQLDVARLEQEVAQADVELERLTIDIENAQRLVQISRDVVAIKRREVDRMEQLRRSNATSLAERDAVELALLTAMQQTTIQENQIRGFDTQTKTLKMSRQLASLHLQRAKLDLARTEIVAPFSGVVIANRIEQNANLVPGRVVAIIEDTSSVEVRCSLRSEDMPFLQASDSARVNAYELPPVPVTIEYQRSGYSYAWDGVLSRQDGLGLDQSTRTVPVRIHVSNPTTNRIPDSMADQLAAGYLNGGDVEPLALVRGMFVKAKLHCHPSHSIAVIPESVLRPGKQVWLVRNQKLKMETLRIARIEDSQVYIDMTHSPLQIDDQIVSSPVPNAKNGLALTVLGARPEKNRLEMRAAVAPVERQSSEPGREPALQGQHRDGQRRAALQ
ncbi:efflux RND transporter periplasmic adaptor subunit [Rubripirellula reticaptiva]|uniref:Multidrug resistance protein MdtN n=1 Tax=Rubripirellula reticaptiva TaxID=2528013 RepID=A0A5C6ESW9_9BACT|nr:HlyD family efflux transporter periplasmic adaptor subunit [Rubripirellula reticaptiva]TWU51755.1 multidrug resistance protein MdtN [Rubripirellula reticaptiva]